MIRRLCAVFIVIASIVGSSACAVERDIVPSLILAVRYYQRNDDAIMQALTTLTGQPFMGCRDAMIWQKSHPEVIPHKNHRRLMLDTLRQTDEGFMRLCGRERSLSINTKMRLG